MSGNTATARFRGSEILQICKNRLKYLTLAWWMILLAASLLTAYFVIFPWWLEYLEDLDVELPTWQRMAVNFGFWLYGDFEDIPGWIIVLILICSLGGIIVFFRRRFHVRVHRIEHFKCLGCGYSMKGSFQASNDVCPECGTHCDRSIYEINVL